MVRRRVRWVALCRENRNAISGIALRVFHRGYYRKTRSATSSRAGTLAARIEPHSMTQFRYVPKKNSTVSRVPFPSYSSRSVASPQPVVVPQLRFLVGDISRALVSLATCAAGKGDLHGITVHFGLDKDGALDLVLQFVCMFPVTGTADTYTYTPTATYYVIVGGRLMRAPDALSHWLADSGDRYAKEVVIRRTDGPMWESFSLGDDVTSITFLYEDELELLLTENGMTDSDLLELVPAAEPAAWKEDGQGGIQEDDYYQSLCWLAVGWNWICGTREKFKNKAADLGSLCPPNCATLYLPHTGQPRRPGC